MTVEVIRLLFRFWRKKDCNQTPFEKGMITIVCGDSENGGSRMTDVRQMQLSFVLQWTWTVRPSEKWSWTPKIQLIYLPRVQE